MHKPILITLLCSLLCLSCSSNMDKKQTDDKPCCKVLNENVGPKDTGINRGLKNWATFFHEFTDSLNYYDITKSKMEFPFIEYSDTILKDDFYDKDYYLMIPKSFISTCQRATAELDNELGHFETNKLFKYSDTESNHFKLLIEYTPEKVIVTHIERIRNTKGQFEHTLYTFKIKEEQYRLISITQ